MIEALQFIEVRMGVSSEVVKGEAAARLVEAAAPEKEVAADMAVGAEVRPGVGVAASRAAVAVAVVADLSCQGRIGQRDYEDVM